VLKKRETSIWEANFQLAFHGVYFSVISLLLLDWDQVSEGGLWKGFSVFAFLSVFFSATGGLLVSLSVKLTSAIAKCYSAPLALVLTGLASSYVFKVECGLSWWFGVACTVVSIVNYFSNAEVLRSAGSLVLRTLYTLYKEDSDSTSMVDVS